MQSLIILKTVFVLATAIVAMVLTVATHRERRPRTHELIRNEYAMPRIVGYGIAALFALMSLNEFGHLIVLVRGAQP